MSVKRPNGISWLNGDNLIAWGLAISVAAHLLFYGGYRAAKYFGWWHGKNSLPSWFKPMATLLEEAKKLQAQQPPPPREEQLIFVEVDPRAATPEPPKETKNYAAVNSLAANPEPQVETGVPKIDGKQTHVAKAEDVPAASKFPLQPTPPKVESIESIEDAKLKPKSAPPPGDLAMAKPTPKLNEGKAESDTGEAPAATHKRPRLLKDVAPTQTAMIGQKMKQNGGVQRNRMTPSFDARGSTFGEYDAAFIRAVSDAWHGMVDERDFARNQVGKVEVEFHLNFDGHISDLHVIESDTSVDMTLQIPCRRAISDPSPFQPWPAEMRRIVGADFREVRFTFYYD